MTRRVAFGLVLSSLWIPGAIAQDAHTSFYPTEKEVALGRSLAAQIEAKTGLLDDPVVVEFVEGITDQLALAAGAEKFLTVGVLDGPEAQTHPLPGGFLLVRSGLVARAETLAEFAAVLAHDIGHIAARHGTRNASEPLGLRSGASVPMIFLGGSTGACSRLVAGASVPVAWRKLAAQHEEEADLLALTYMDKAGYDPNGLADAFDHLAADGMPEAVRVTATVRDKAGEYSAGGRTYIATSSEFIEMRARLAQALPRERVERSRSLLRTPGR